MESRDLFVTRNIFYLEEAKRVTESDRYDDKIADYQEECYHRLIIKSSYFPRFSSEGYEAYCVCCGKGLFLKDITDFGGLEVIDIDTFGSLEDFPVFALTALDVARRVCSEALLYGEEEMTFDRLRKQIEDKFEPILNIHNNYNGKSIKKVR